MARSEEDDRILLAPGARHVEELRLPSVSDPLPRIDDRLAPPETRLEYIRGAEIFAAPADPPHATHHCDLTYVLRAHVAPGYRAAVDMLTRTGPATDIAPDASVFREAPDPETGGRQLEELAFEVTSEQAISVPTLKARDLIQRGVRRVFCVLVKQRRVMEWSRVTDAWSPLRDDATVDDRTFVRPLPIAALLDATASDEAVAQALLRKHVPVLEHALQQRADESRIEGKIEGKAAAILDVLRARRIVVPDEIRVPILGCKDLSTIDRWLGRAVTATDAAAVVAREGD